MDNKVFRKSALDRISSPEQLNEYMKVAGSGMWCILGGLAAIFIAFFTWGVTGSIPETVNMAGTVIMPDGSLIEVYCYLPIDETKMLKEGMDVRISLDYAPKEQYGYIYGQIKKIGRSPVTVNSLAAYFNEGYEFLSIPAGNVIEVIIEPRVHDGKPQWSTDNGASVDVIVGSSCAITAVTAERKPYELLFR